MIELIKLIAFYMLVIQVLVRTDDSTPINTPISTATTESTRIQTSTSPSTTPQSPIQSNNKNNQTDLVSTLKNATRYCECDLTGNHCDLNCCCDSDCDSESKKLFSKCLDNESTYRLLDARYCYNQNLIYKNNTNYVLERMTNIGGLFCIYVDNTKQQSYLMDKKIVKNLEELNGLNLRPEFNWTINSVNYDLSTPELVDKNQLANQYRADKEIFSLNLKKVDQSGKQIKSLSKLAFPFSLVIRNGECNSRKEVAYLNEFNSYCYKWIRNLQADCRSNTVYDVNNYYLILIGNGGQLNDNESPSIENLNHFCRQFNCVQTQAGAQVKTISYQNQICSNLVRSVSYEIVYNEVGIKRVRVNFEYDDLKQLDGRPIKQFQKFNVKFTHENLLNKSMNISHYSGNLGYQLERPLIGQYKIDEEQIVSPFKFVNLQKTNDECDQSKVNEQDILFGLNHRSGCLFDLNKNLASLENESSRQPSTDVCDQLNELIKKVFQQKQTFNQLSAYGKYNVSMVDNWTAILKRTKKLPYSFAVNENLNGIKTNCQLLKQVNYEFIYAMVADLREPQRKLVSAIQTEVYHPFDFCSNALQCTNRPIELSTSIQFIQMKREKRIRFADSPAFKLELPEDLFYPFL